ncbi:MAG TPA: thermonuclease family protein [Bacteroidia bacterium]|nr:thermonuclease family protein [Bacteroidia bacterium]
MKNNLLILFFLVSFSCFSQTVKVERVIDGDTYVIETGEKIRMIGINAPEMSTEFGDDAKAHLEKLIEGKEVMLVEDLKAGKKDKYKRLLRYTIVNGEDINQRMVCDGFAVAYTRFKFTKKQSYKDCQEVAELASLGMWGIEEAETPAASTNVGEDTITMPKSYFYGGVGTIAVLLGLLLFKRRK